MSRQPFRRRRGYGDSIRVAGREWPIQEQLVIGRRTYLILEKTGNSGRERWMAFDPYASPEGDLRAILSMPTSPSTKQHLRVLTRLSARNPNLPAILEWHPQGNRVFVVLTWVNGPDLKLYLDDVRAGRSPRPSVIESIRLVRGLAHGLSQLHQRHAIVHADIKPANLILSRRPSRLIPIDFGSAWLSANTVNRDPGDGLSPPYAAPELQQQGPAPSGLADQFAASVVLYELLTLRLPYDGLGGQAGASECINQLRNKVAPPSKYFPDADRLPINLRKSIDRFVSTCLDLDYRRRFPTSRDWVNAFDALFYELRPRAPLSSTNRRMTGVVKWIADRLRISGI